MTPLMPCPRCTQVLPVTAGFCRRCGVAVRPPVATPRGDLASTHGWGLLGRSAMGGGVLAGAVLFAAAWNVTYHTSTAVAPPASPPVYAAPRVVYPLTPPSAYPPTLTVPPGYEPARTWAVPPYPTRTYDRRGEGRYYGQAVGRR